MNYSSLESFDIILLYSSMVHTSMQISRSGQESLFQPVTLVHCVSEHIGPVGGALTIAFVSLLHGFGQPFLDLFYSIMVLMSR